MTRSQKWIKPSAIVATIVLGLGVGFYIWDYHHYPIPMFMYPMTDDVFSEKETRPGPFHDEQMKLISATSSLRDQKNARYNSQILPTINLYDHPWEYFDPVG